MKINLAALALTVLLAGCGHNGMVYMNGTSWQLGYNPETNQIGAGYLDGETLLVGSRENTSVEIELGGDSEVDATRAAAQAAKVKKIRYSTGIQVNGYLVDLAEASPGFAAAVLKLMKESGRTTRYFIIRDGEPLEITREEYENTDGAWKIDGAGLSVNRKETAE